MEKIETFFTKTCRYKNLYDPIDGKIELVVKIHENEQGESGFSFASVIKVTKTSLGPMIYERLVSVKHLDQRVIQNLL